MSWGCFVVSLCGQEVCRRHLATSFGGVLGRLRSVLGAPSTFLGASWSVWRRLEEENRAKMDPISDQEGVESDKK